MTGKKELGLAILEYEKYLETDENNQWAKDVLKGLKKCEQDLNELQQYKQLERELGIDLITLFKALKNGVYVKNEYAYDYYEIEYKKVRGIEKTGLSAISNICEFPECDEILCYSNYDKFWALTEEKLKNE